MAVGQGLASGHQGLAIGPGLDAWSLSGSWAWSASGPGRKSVVFLRVLDRQRGPGQVAGPGQQLAQAAKVSCFHVFWIGSVVLVRQLDRVSKWSRPQKCRVFTCFGQVAWSWSGSWTWSRNGPGHISVVFSRVLDRQRGSGQVAGRGQQMVQAAKVSRLYEF